MLSINGNTWLAPRPVNKNIRGSVIFLKNFHSCERRNEIFLYSRTSVIVIYIRDSFTDTGGLGASIILGSLDPNKYLGKLISFLDPVLPRVSYSDFVKCWHAKADGWSASTFHSNCDGKGPTVTIIKVNDSIFGGYTDVSWSSKYILAINFFFGSSFERF